MLAKRPPRYLDTPVTSTTRAIGSPSTEIAAGLDCCGRPRPQGRGARGASLLVAALVARLAQQLAVLLLGHPLAALLDDGAHVSSQSVDRVGRNGSARKAPSLPGHAPPGRRAVGRRPAPSGRPALQAVSTALST